MRKQKHGFTLIELLAVIVILAIVATIATPLVFKYIEASKRGALLETANNLVHAVDLKHFDTSETHIYYIKDGTISPVLKINGSISGDGFIEVDKDKNVRISLSNGKYCAKKYFSDANIQVSEGNCDDIPGNIVNLDQSGASIPQMDESMVAIRYDGTNWVKADKNNALKEYQWYDYEQGMWANMAVVKRNKRSEYLEASLGSKIEEDDIIGYFVGIPSFSYRLTTGNNERSFDLQFTSTEETHPAFLWGEEQVTGFWFGKYELSGSLEQLYVLPGKPILKSISLKKMYQAVEELNILKKENQYATKVSELHLMKNTEWGAVTILSQSKYGICHDNRCDKVAKNETWNTGYADRNSFYDSVKGMKASTTGNIYGIYDMSGGSWEFTMGTNKVSTLGVDVEQTHYNDYSSGKGIKGDLTTEDGTSNWYGSTANFLTNTQNWFVRGGDVNTSDASLFWYRGDSSNGGFRNGFRLAYVLKEK